MILNALSKINSIQQTVSKINMKHIAIIMDGNRRWATKKKLPSISGHLEGVSALKKIIKAADNFGIKYLTVYDFSTENWGRKKLEVEFLMNLLKETIKNERKKLHEKNVKIRIIGDLKPLNNDLKNILKEIEELTAQNSGLNLQIAINYGARNEITNAVKCIYADIKTGIINNAEQITDNLVSSYLYTADIPDPDLLIRTGGEQRISNYLLWQIAYTEFYVTDIFWPDFDENELEKAVLSFSERNRRFGRD